MEKKQQPKKELVPNNRKVIYTNSMLDKCERLDKEYAGRKTHTHIYTPEEIVPAKNTNDATLSNEINNKTARR